MSELLIRVYYEDTDAGGVLFHAATIRYLDRGRTEWMRARGYSLQTLMQQREIVFAVYSLTMDYQMPGRLDDELMVRTEALSVQVASLTFAQSLWRQTECLGKAMVRVACLHLGSGRAVRIPQDIYKKLQTS